MNSTLRLLRVVNVIPYGAVQVLTTTDGVKTLAHFEKINSNLQTVGDRCSSQAPAVFRIQLRDSLTDLRLSTSKQAISDLSTEHMRTYLFRMFCASSITTLSHFIRPRAPLSTCQLQTRRDRNSTTHTRGSFSQDCPSSFMTS